jgi:bifunctional non-homologous end joining protein LigD
MRDPERTPEPFGEGRPAGAGGPLRFVVQKHAARRLHWDFRLELGGALRSWAVPRGPSADPADKRLALPTEDHPLEYADFEGVIPPGNYGAGAVIVWDRGIWVPTGDPEQGLSRGDLKFELRGYKLRGGFALVRTRRGERGKEEWLLVKHRDAWVDPRGEGAYGPESVLSGRTVEEVAAGRGRAEEAVGEAARLGAPRRWLPPSEERPMLAESREAAFTREGWVFELKYDGYRMLARREGTRARLRYRSGQDATRLWPEVARAVETLPLDDLLLDGELVVLDAEGRPSFQGLQARAGLSRPEEIERAAAERPATLFSFDLLALGGHDLRPLPLLARKALLARVLPRLGPVRYADHLETRGEELLREVAARGLEGIVAKRADAPYRPGRSPAWLKIRLERAGDFAVVGFTEPAGTRRGFGALHLAVREGKREGEALVYAGSVGSGFSESDLEAIRARLDPRVRPTPACGGAVPRGRGNVWVEPEMVVEVRYRQWTREGLLRHPVFARLREDKRPDEAVREDGSGEPPPAAPPAEAPREVKVTNPDKVFFPGEGITKGELVAYYREVAPFMLPFLRDRPLVLTRFPDGIEGKSFFQKDAPSWRPAWMRTVRVRSEEADRDVDHFLVYDADGLAWIANLGAIPIHVWASRAGSLERPDWCVLDLDPKEAPFAHVVRLACAVRALCESIGLPSHPKTTGQRGLHVLVPLGGQLTHAQSRTLAELLARAVEGEHPDLSTTARALADRGGRVYLDYLQNGRGKTIVAPYAVRPRPGAPVSVPLRWSEVGPGLDPSKFTIRNVVARAARLGEDPLARVLLERPDLAAALERLRGRVEARSSRDPVRGTEEGAGAIVRPPGRADAARPPLPGRAGKEADAGSPPPPRGTGEAAGLRGLRPRSSGSRTRSGGRTRSGSRTRSKPREGGR